jgi:hypothetical protein
MLFVVSAGLVLAVMCAAFAHMIAVWNDTPVTPPQALTIEDVRPLFNFSLP